ncbi:hypothetical protein Tco_0037762 [Tanacetum coccineum]
MYMSAHCTNEVSLDHKAAKFRADEVTHETRSVFPEKLLLPPLQSRWETSQSSLPLFAGIIVVAAVELLMLPEFV